LTETDQLKVWHTTFPELLNVVILVKTNLKRGAQAHVGLFSSDLTLPAHKLMTGFLTVWRSPLRCLKAESLLSMPERAIGNVWVQIS